MENQLNNFSQFQLESLIQRKVTLRFTLKKIRKEIPPWRRKEASTHLLSELLPALTPFDRILSFSSFDDEIDTTLLNDFLALSGKLLLPKTEGGSLRIFEITDLKNQIRWIGNRKEPNPQKCQELDPKEIQIILVPALGFDSNNNRLGYGKGYYDRFLSSLKSPKTIGVGFLEQLLAMIPTLESDFTLEKVSLF